MHLKCREFIENTCIFVYICDLLCIALHIEMDDPDNNGSTVTVSAGGGLKALKCSLYSTAFCRSFTRIKPSKTSSLSKPKVKMLSRGQRCCSHCSSVFRSLFRFLSIFYYCSFICLFIHSFNYSFIHSFIFFPFFLPL